jgi:aspartyl-tRNA(Asn)/glutamyl-tRNA(Gln) amidotransferase subunit A
LTIADAGTALRDGSVTSVDLTRQAIAAADRFDPELGTFLLRFREESLEAAEQADQELAAGRDRGALHGIPLGIKDIITTEEGPTTAQSVVHDPEWNRGDAVVVSRLRRAGGVIMGKVTTMEFAAANPDPEKPFPIPRNPWDLRTWPGGSSSGTGSGVAAGFFLGGLGTDTGGSIRIPSAFCGITGLMPTFGRVPKSGCVPLGYSLDHIGPMARSARDCALMLGALAGHDPSCASAVELHAPDYPAALTGDLTGLRVGVDLLERVAADGDDPQARPAVESVAVQLAALGAEVVPVEVPHYAMAMPALLAICGGEMFAYHAPDARSRLSDYFAGNRRQLASAAFCTGADYVQAQRFRRVVMKDLATLYADVDLILTPTLTVGAIALDVLGPDLGSWFAHLHTPYWDLTGNPVISIPAGFTGAGLPLGVQLAGRPFQEDVVLKAANAYQEQTDHHLQLPPLIAGGKRDDPLCTAAAAGVDLP